MPARDDPNPRIAAICLVIISLIAGAMTVFFPRFSCFYELRDIDNYTIELNAAIFGCCFFFSLLPVLLWLKWPHSRGISYFSQVCIFIFCFGTSFYGISAFAILDIANNQLTSASSSSGDDVDVLSTTPVKAAMKLLSPDRNLELDWANQQQTSNLCRLQKQFQCMMWRRSDTCNLVPSSSSSTITSTAPQTFADDVPKTEYLGLMLQDRDDISAQNNTNNANITCLTCGIFTMNITQTNRPISCFAAMVSCFIDGREQYTTTLENPGGKKYAYVADKYVMIVGSVLILVLALFAFWKNCMRQFTEPAKYGDFEHGVESDYRALTSSPKYY